LVVDVAADQVGNDRLGQQVEDRRIAEEAGDVDQQVLGEKLQLVAVVLQGLQIAADVVGPDIGHRHAALDPSPKRAAFVEAEIVHSSGAQKLNDGRQPVRRCLVGIGTASVSQRPHAAVVACEGFRDIGHAQCQIDAAGLDGAARHAAEAGFVGILCDDQAALLLDRAQSQAAVGPGA
jgi:hypothetical protein